MGVLPVSMRSVPVSVPDRAYPRTSPRNHRLTPFWYGVSTVAVKRSGRPRLPLVNMTRPPRTIALVGADGSGKTTQAHRLADDLAAEGLRAVYRRNAGGRRWFGRLAARLGRGDDADDLLGRRAMLFAESVLRWLAILRTLLRRALTGEITVMDRYAVCQYAS